MSNQFKKCDGGVVCNHYHQDHEVRLLKLEKRKKSKIPAWFQDWNDNVFTTLIKDVKYLKDNAVMKDEFETFKTEIKEEVYSLKNSLKPEVFDDLLKQHLKPEAFKNNKK